MLENIRLAFQGVWSHKLRSMLTMLGIIIGIASIISIVSTIQGTNEQIKQNLIGGGNVKLDGIGILAGVVNGIGVALQILLPKYFAKDYERDTLLVYGFLGAAVVLMFGIDFSSVAGHMSGTPVGTLIWNLFGIGILCTMVANVSCVKSTQYVEATTTSILSALEVVVGTLVGFLIFNEHMTLLQLLGAVIIVAGAVGSEIRRK